MDLQQLKELDAVLFNHNYSDEVFAGLLPHVAAYLQLAHRLRSLPLGEVKSATVVVAGGKR